MAWPVVLGAVVAGAATVGQGYAQSRAIKSANRRNREIAESLNTANWEYFQRGRGLDGYSWLPYYAQVSGPDRFDPETGEYVPGEPVPLEPTLFNAARDLYESYGGSLEEHRANLDELIAPARQAIRDSKSVATSIFDGSRLSDELSDQTAVAGGRTDQTRALNARNAEAMRDSLGNLQAANATQGFVGGSSAYDQARLGQRTAAAQNAATANSANNILNAAEIAALMSGDQGRRLQNLNLPLEQAGRGMESVGLTDQALIGRLKLGHSVFDPFRLPVQSYEASELPTTLPNTALANTVSQLGSGIGSLLASYGLNQQKQAPPNPYLYTAPPNPYATSLTPGNVA